MPLSITYYADAGKKIIDPQSKLSLLAADCRFTEGPVFHPEGFYLFSDIPANAIYKIAPGEEKVIYHKASGFDGTDNEKELLSEQIGSNGLCMHPSGAVVVCQHGNGAVRSLKNNEWLQQINSFEGKRFNSPNDVVAASDGSIFFTDPPYGLKDQQLNKDFAQEAAAVYAVDNNEVKCISTRYQYPNGICLSADEEQIYVCSSKPFEKFITIFDRKTGAEKGVLANENSDGLKMDKAGNFWLCTKEGIVVLNEKGERLLGLELPTVPANMCFGKEGTEVLITARQNVFLLQMAV